MQNLNSQWTYGSSIRAWSEYDLVTLRSPGHPSNTLTKTVGSNTTTYAWDYENRLTSVTLPSSGGTVTFKYDPMGRRIYKSVSTGDTSVFAYDSDNLIEEANSSGTVVARYEQTDNTDEPLAMLRSSATSYYQGDGLSSVTSLSNGAGALAQSYNFDSFGNRTSTGSIVNPFQYTGREFDSETGLYYNRARYYDPASGRFAAEDPLLFGGRDTNFYAYVGNDPVDYIDPFGMDRICSIQRLCPDVFPPKPTWTSSHALLPGSVRYTTPGGHTFWVPPSANWCKEFAAAQKSGLFSIGAVAQGGTYDLQRNPTTHTFYPQYTAAANFSVGVYMKGAGWSRWATYTIGVAYGITHSNNYGLPGASRWAQNWGDGWDAANSGRFSNPNCGCN